MLVAWGRAQTVLHGRHIWIVVQLSGQKGNGKSVNSKNLGFVLNLLVRSFSVET